MENAFSLVKIWRAEYVCTNWIKTITQKHILDGAPLGTCTRVRESHVIRARHGLQQENPKFLAEAPICIIPRDHGLSKIAVQKKTSDH